MNRRRVLPLLCLAGTVLFWGTSFAPTKDAYAVLSPMAVVWLRMLVAASVFAPFWRRLPRPDYRRGDWLLLAASLACIPCAYFALEGFAMVYTSSSQAGVITAIAPLIVALGAWAFLRETLNWRQSLGLAISVAMVIALALTGTAQDSAPAPWLGNSLEVGAMIAAAGSTLTIKHLSARYHPWFLAGAQASVGAIFFAPLALVGEPIPWATLTPQTWLTIAYLGIFPGLIAFGLYNSALKLLPASGAAMALNLIPAVAVLAGWLLLGEALTPPQLLACALIIAAVSFAQKPAPASTTGIEEDATSPPITSGAR